MVSCIQLYGDRPGMLFFFTRPQMTLNYNVVVPDPSSHRDRPLRTLTFLSSLFRIMTRHPGQCGQILFQLKYYGRSHRADWWTWKRKNITSSVRRGKNHSPRCRPARNISAGQPFSTDVYYRVTSPPAASSHHPTYVSPHHDLCQSSPQSKDEPTYWLLPETGGIVGRNSKIWI